MSTSAADSPIQSLSFDVLWRIFDINADIFNDASALKTTLATSYVCRDWRSFLLSSTSIWAHVMDLDHSLWGKVEGSREMIRRSGTAFLWMKVHYPFGYLRDGKHILDIIDTNWDRIQKFDATIQVDFVDQWTLLYRPAPCLQSLSLSFDRQSPRFDNLLPALFGGSAPMLRYFRLKSNRLNITAMSWLHQVRSMELGIKLTISETLGVLASTMNLTSLHLDDVAADSSVVALSPVSLPKLARLDLSLSNTLSPGAALLEHMFIPPSCKVIISAKEIQRREIDKKSNFKPIIEAISTCAQRSFAHNSPQSVYVAITPCSFTFESAYQSHKPNFAFHLNLARAHTFPGHALTMLLREFSLPGLAKVTWFGFKITAVQRQVPGLAAFIACLPSVNVIVTEQLSLRHLRAYAPPKGASNTDPHIVFPVLKTLQLGPFTPSRDQPSKYDNVRDPISKYVMGRISRGHAISIIEFAEGYLDSLPSMDLLRKADFIRKANGLRILWWKRGVAGTQEHICGQSPPQTLVGI